MLEILMLQKADVPDGALVEVGPRDGVLGRPLLLPSTFTRNAFLSSNKIKMTLECVFSGERYEVKSVRVESLDGYVSTRDLTQLGIPRVIRSLAPELVPNYEVWTAEGLKKEPKFMFLKHDYGYLAQMYWLHSAIYGKPRLEITNALGISKSTSNVLLRRIEEEIPLPRENSSKTDFLMDV
jgi:hypothetical protein